METKKVYCKDGTSEEVCVKDCPITEQYIPPPCENHGGVDNRIIKGLNNTQRWAYVIGGTIFLYLILYKSGILKSKVVE